MTKWTPEAIRERVAQLGDWFHNLDLKGVRTAPNHFLYDYPRNKFSAFAHALPTDLSGKSVLDVGCNGGFYSLEMKRRGAARVLGIDSDDRYLAQARFAAEVSEQNIEFRNLSVYDVARLGERFDVVLFMGVFYHLRHPLLALDLLYEHVVSDLMVFQCMQRGAEQIDPVAPDYDFFEVDHFDSPGYPKLHFIECSYAHDPTNWWTPNAAATQAMLRAAGFAIEANPEREVFLCRRVARPSDAGAVYPARGNKEAQS
jgi:tRNA (mo5U34)-methyltransferase